MADGRLDLVAMIDTLAEWTAAGPDVTEGDRERADEALHALGIPELLATLSMAEEVIRFGNSFHSIARFFADGSVEQAYVSSLDQWSDPAS